ncbi:MAG TPA: UPF0182 family protein [Candidatus Bathyarchaeia archaeon]|nr:UPF0182 family protein [Candidatus Bathyarchaeia archaeon]
MTEIRVGSRKPFRIGLLTGILAILIVLGMQFILLRELSVFNTGLGLWVLATEFVSTAALLLALVFVGSYFAARIQRQSGSRAAWVGYYIVLGLASFAAFTLGMNAGLTFDVKYSTYATKAGINFLNLQYLNGAVIWTTLLLTALFMLSDPRVSVVTGSDGKRHFYTHSKLLGILRLLSRTNLGAIIQTTRRSYYESSSSRPSFDWDVGETPDHAVLSKNGKLQWNDKFLVSSPPFLAWTTIKFLFALGIAASIANDIALRFVTIQNYLVQMNSSWFAQVQSYFSILGLRLSGTYQVSPTFGIDSVFTFEAFKFILSIIGLAFGVLGIRLGISLVANAMVGLSKRAFGMSRVALSNFFIIIWLPIIYAVLSSGAWVYDVGTSFVLSTLVIVMIGVAFLAGYTRTQRILHVKITRFKGLLILAIVLVSTITLPVYGTYLRAQSGQYINYQWNPAYVPTIQYTRWAYGIDSVTSADSSLITSLGTQTNTLDHIRIFTNESARLNMKPLVGVNWMSIDNAPVDIIYLNGTEYWVSVLQLVPAGLQNDPDVWRTQHLLLTHSEKILAVNAATTQAVDITKIWNLTQSPQIYYGEGGLWQSVDEVYLNIPGFTETHLSNYTGPPSYNGTADYTYKGFWLYWKFFWQGRFDFANGAYGNIKALEYRDADTRLSNILLPDMQSDPDPYPVVDKQGNIYILHWVWIKWQSPSDFADYPDHTDTSILRLFAATLTNMKTGEVTGYLYNNGKSDYVRSFYNSMYPQWNQQMPAWLLPQLRYPESYFNAQQEVYNFYFQTDPLQWQRNVFLQSTETTRFIITPINGTLTWAAVRLVEIYHSPSQNLAGLYIAPAGIRTGQVYLIRFPEGTTVIGPNSAVSAVTTDPGVKTQLTLHPDWTTGNILLYSVNGRLIYVIPYYGTQGNLTVPEMVAVVDASTKQVGSYFISNPNSYTEVGNATTKAVNNIGISTGTQTTVNGTLAYRYQYEQGGNTRWILGINTTSGQVQVLAKVETLTTTDIFKINNTNISSTFTVVVDNSTTPATVLRVQ